MRIIAGEMKGRLILPPAGQTTRPLPDRVKAALFSIMGGALPPVGAADFFSGTGSFGLEALSRGASHCWFYERDREALRRLRANLESTGLADRATIVAGDLFHAPFPPRDSAVGGLGIVSFDPPYPFLEQEKTRQALRSLLKELAASGWPAADADIVFRHERRSSVPLEETGLIVRDARTYGGMTLSFLGRPGAAPLPEGETSEAGPDEPAGDEGAPETNL